MSSFREAYAHATRDTATELVDLVRASFPSGEPISLIADDWRWQVAARTFISRATTIMDSLTLLLSANKKADAWVLVRALFETVVTFAWVAISPDEHSRRVLSAGIGQVLRAHKSRVAGFEFPLLPDAVEDKFLAARAEGPRNPPGLLDMAGKVDEFWGTLDPSRPSNVSEADWTPLAAQTHYTATSCRGLYELLYRPGSAATHADLFFMTLFHVSDNADGLAVSLDEQEAMLPTYQSHVPYVYAVPVYVFAVDICAKKLGWPAEAEFQAVIDRMSERTDEAMRSLDTT
jgi:hypothetical protein